MIYLLSSFAIFLTSAGLMTLSKNRTYRKALGCGGVFVGSVLGLIPAIQVLSTTRLLEKSLGSPLPYLTIALGIDPLSAFFLMAIFGLSGIIAIYSWGYLKDQDRFLPSLPFFPLLVASMAAVTVARDGFLFLVCWEIMSLSSFFLVTAEHEIREVRHAGWVYLIATHLATAFLMAFFVLLFKESGSFSFHDFVDLGSISPVLAGTLFLFALIGFGTKAGIFPFHVWLPHAHPAAPSFISALLSGVMIKTGIYGILRALTFLGPPPLWWGELLMGLGILSSVLGVLYALLQHDLKRLLAYHSVENIGIIAIGVGLGLVGTTRNNPSILILGFGGALLHVWNHAIFKGLLFLGAGHMIHSAQTRVIDHLGGLFKKMPLTGTTFLIASAAICGLPLLNGFISEWLIYLGLFQGIQEFYGLPLFFSVAGIVGIAFAGGLAIACFSKVCGVVFLGEPRSEQAAQSHEAPISLLIPMAILAALCFFIGLFPQIVARGPLAQVLGEWDADRVLISLPLTSLGILSLFFLGFCVVLTLLHRSHIREKGQKEAVTWDCGYAKPSPRMQYTASSFAEPLEEVFRGLLKPISNLKKSSSLFPERGHFSEWVEDLAEHRWFAPLFNAIDKIFLRARRLQKGRIQSYLALIFVTLLALLFWEVWFGI
ncbi:MAG: hydrogenase [Deltaproteobacteria bacterium]|nr:hydrogenase [Deltaproteobacteria bacterium]